MISLRIPSQIYVSFLLSLRRLCCGPLLRSRVSMGKSSKRKAAGVLPDDMEDKEWELVAPNRHEVIIKRSRFIAFAGPVNTTTEALAFIEASSERDARHNCWAYLLDGQEFRCNDDGEPGGTAGRPILAAIENSKVVNVAVCVVRYFGGIKLGAGGLVRLVGQVISRVEPGC